MYVNRIRYTNTYTYEVAVFFGGEGGESKRNNK